MERHLITKKEMLDYLKISKGTLDKMMRRREIPFLKIGKAVRFKRQEIDAWLETKRVK